MKIRFTPCPKPEPKEKKKVYVLKRTPLKKKVYKIPKMSEKRSVESKAYSTLRLVYLENHPECEINKEGICQHTATTIHHSYSGKDRDAHYLDIKTWFSACMDCHTWVHKFPREAREQGFLK